MKLTTTHLTGGHLAEVMCSRMFPADQATEFRRRIGPPAEAKRTAFRDLFGWMPATEAGEFSGLMPAYEKLQRYVSDVWMLGDPLAEAPTLLKKSKLPLAAHGLTMLTGLVEFGHDPSGDGCLLGTIADGETAEVWIHNHENGEIETVFPSIAAFIARYFTPDGEDEDLRPLHALINRLSGDHQKTAAKQQPWMSVEQLFSRAQWLMPLLTDEEPYQLAKKLEQAPTFAHWLVEKPLLTTHPMLANYWMLAHFALGNESALTEALDLARHCPGRMTAALRAQVEKGRIGDLDDTIRRLAAKNADPSLRPPTSAVAASSTTDGKHEPSAKALLKRLAAGEYGWDLVKETSNVETHDALLKQMQINDGQIRDYFNERTDSPYSQWPYHLHEFPQRFAQVVATAFRSGLQYDTDHKKSFAGLTRTLAAIEGDAGVEAAREAFATLAVDDERIAWLAHWLEHSTHPLTDAVLEVGALRFFTTLDEAKRLHQRRAKQGTTLNAMAMDDGFFVEVLCVALRRGGEIARRLALKVLEWRSNITLFKTAAGLAVRVAARTREAPVWSWAKGYADMVIERRSNESHIEADVEFNLAECCLAMAQVDSATALPWLRQHFAAPRKHPEVDLAIRAALLGGLLACEPEEPTWRGWLERFLGRRTHALVIHNALRAVEESRIRVPLTWIAPHHYDALGCTDSAATHGHFGQRDRWAITTARVARRVVAVLGHPPLPDLDDEDEFASRAAKRKELPLALLRPHRHRIAHVFKRIREDQVKDPDIITHGDAILHDLLRFAGDDMERRDNDARNEGLVALSSQGPAALPVFHSLLRLPHLGKRFPPFILLCARACGAEAEVRAWLQHADKAAVLAELAEPTDRTFAVLELVAAHAAARWGEAAIEACLQALHWRYRFTHADHAMYEDYEPSLAQLPRVVASLGHADHLAALLPADHRDYYPCERAVNFAKTFTPTPITSAWNEPLTLTAPITEYNEKAPSYSLALDSRTLTWTSAWRLRGDLGGDQGEYRRSGTWSFAHADEALAFATLELDAAARLGYATPAGKTKAAAPKRTTPAKNAAALKSLLAKNFKKPAHAKAPAKKKRR